MDFQLPNSERLPTVAGLWHPNDPAQMDMD